MVQDRFVGDIGDFSNHGLLRALCGTPAKPVDGLKLGVVEYFTVPSEKDQKNGAGNKITYLKISKHNTSTYRQCDEELYDALRKTVGESLVSGKKLKIDPNRAKLLLPVDDRYYDAPVPVGDRNNWLADALRVTSEADLVFINPDNGIASESQEKKVRPVHVTIEELLQIFEEGKGLIIYQQIGQGLKKGQTADDFIKQTSGRLRLMLELKRVRQLWAFWWHREAGRVYFIVAQTQEHEDKIEERLEAFRKSEWMKKGHFTEVDV